MAFNETDNQADNPADRPDSSLMDMQFSNPADITMMPTSGINSSMGKKDSKAEPMQLEEVGSGNVRESPFKIIKAAAGGKLQEFEKLYLADPNRLNLPDGNKKTVVHHAAANGKINILEAIVRHGGDLDAQDKHNNTALHYAVKENKLDTIDFLIKNGANTAIQNDTMSAPIHYAVELDRQRALQSLLSHSVVDVDLGGHLGCRPLHYAASRDRPECAQILLDHNACLCSKCDTGKYPVHMAAENGSSKTLEVMVKNGQKRGYARNHLLQFKDACNNNPLHRAVNSGYLEAVSMCINAGVLIDSVQEDKSTAVHLAAAQGSIDMLRVMFELQPERKDICIFARDVMQMTPLHKAALFDRADVADFLLDNGAEINAQDADERTPVLIAASKKAWQTVNVLLGRNADYKIQDKRNRNILHVIIKNGGRPKNFRLCLCDKKMADLLKETDDFGCTPLHYASKQGHLTTIELLISMGATLSAKNKKRQNPLHFAARYGRYNTCRHILDSLNGPATINDADGDGMTPLHAAAENGHTKVVQLLLQKGGSTHRCNAGDTPLHKAAENGYTHSMDMILSIHPHLLDAANKAGDTALNVASRNGHASAVTLLLTRGAAIVKNHEDMHFFDIGIKEEQKDVCVAIISHDRWREAMDRCSTVYGSPMAGLVQHMPEVCQMVLDRCKTSSGQDTKKPDFCHKYDFRYLQMPIEEIRQRRQNGEDYMPLEALNIMVKFNRVECLSHPLCVTFLRTKWRLYGFFCHMINLFLYGLFLTSLTTFVCTYNVMSHDDCPRHTSSQGASHSNGTSGGTGHHKMTYLQTTMAVIILTFCVLNIIKEIAQVVQQRFKYFRDMTNYLEWTLYLTSAAFIAPFINQVSTHWQWQCAAIAIFLAWFILLLHLQRFDFLGIYVVMFLEILRTLVQVLIVFSILIVAFGMSFYILMSTKDQANYSYSQQSYKTPGLALLTTVIMMLGNIDYIDTWVGASTDNDPNTLHFDSLGFVILVAFILLMPILLINLLIGLAVGDIEAVQRDARLKRMAMQVELHSNLERKLPQRLLEHVYKAEWKVYPNRYEFRWQKIWRRLMRNRALYYDPFREIYDPDDPDPPHQLYLFDELNKQKRKLKQISASMTKQYDLLRLIVQKMEIKTEADDNDDEDGHDDGSIESSVRAISWSPGRQHMLLKQAAVMSRWRKSNTD